MAATGPSQAALGRIFGELTSKDEDARLRAKDALRDLVATASRDLSTEQFTRLNNDINRRIFELCSSSDDKLGGVMAIEALIDLNAEESTKLTRFANYLRLVLPTNDVPTMIAASKALGRLATPGGTLTSDLMEFEVKRALEWLQSDRHESRRHAAVLVLKELARNSPTLFYAYVPQVLDLIWIALRDPKVTIRESAAECLSSCLEIISQRETQLRIQWYTKMLEEAQNGLRVNNADWIHGSLLAYRELLLRAGMFMHERYNEVCEVVLRHRDHKDGLIRRTVVSLIPSLAGYNPEEFVATYLHKCMGHLLNQLKKEKDRSASFIAIGQVAIAVGSSITPYLDHILASIKEGLAIAAKGRNKASVNDAAVFQCISMLATAVGQALTKYLHDLLELMFACGLTEPLRQALVDLAHNIPPLLPVIQERLLNLLSIILSGQNFRAPGSPERVNSNLIPNMANQQPADARDSELITLALNTLGGFDFTGITDRIHYLQTGNVLNEFVRDVVINYVEDDNPEVRKAAALSSCQLFIKDPIVYQTSNHAIQVVSQVLEKLLTVGITDPDPNIRLLVLSALDEKFDRHLAQSRNIRTLFIALNDEVFQIREIAISIIGRLTAYNPGHVMPSLRKTLIQLLTELEYSTVNRNKEEAARLLGLLISNAKLLVKPYVEPVLKVLLPKAHDPNAGVASAILACIGELAKVGGEDLVPYIKNLMPLILETLQDQSSSVKRDTSLRTLGELASNSGYVIQPYTDFPNLFELFIGILKSEQSTQTRRETVKVMGILGALDPYKYQTVDKVDKVAGTADQKDSNVDISMLMIGLGNTEEYYPAVVMSSLMMILKDPSLTTHHTAVIQSIMSMYKALGLKCVSFLPDVIPAYISVMRNCPPTILEFYFQQLGILVGIVKQHIRNFMQDILNLIRDFWRTQANLQTTILRLVEAMARALEDEFKPFLPTLVPLMLQTFETDNSGGRQTTRAVLQTLVTFGPNIEEYMHLVLPAIVDTVERNEAPVFLRKEAIITIARLSRVANLSDHASRIIHPIARVIVSSPFELRNAALDTLCALVFGLGYEYLIFIPMVNKLLVKSKISHPNYESLVSKLLKGESLPQDLNPDRKFGDGRVEDVSSTDSSAWKLSVNPDHLKNAWEASQRSTREDWQEWIRRLNLELLKESPSPALRSCATLASSYAPLAKELFNAAFLSCWVELEDESQEELMKALETALTSANTPPDLVQILLNLAEYMEHADKPLPFDIRTLSAYAGRCHAYAKALHYKETEYISDRGPDTIENLISINKELQLPDAAIGILTQAQRHEEFELLETWYEKLQRWDDALAAWNGRPENEQNSPEVLMGKMRCYHALGEWDELSRLVQSRWKHEEMSVRRKIAPHAAAGAWNLGQWELIDDYVSVMRSDSADYSFFKAIICLHRNEFSEAAVHIRGARDLVDRELTALVGESYARAYSVNVRVQMLAELEEIIHYKQSPPEKRLTMRRTWMKRLMGVQRNVDVWQRLLKVRALVITPQENMDMWIKFANLCRKSNRMSLAEKTLNSLLGGDDESRNRFTATTSPRVVYAWLKFNWARGEKGESLTQLQEFSYHLAGELGIDVAESIASMTDNEPAPLVADDTPEWQDTTSLLARCFHKQAEWQVAMQDQWIDQNSTSILQSFSLATLFDPTWHKAWHSFAIAHFDVVSRAERMINEKSNEDLPAHLLKAHVVPAVKGFFKSISLSERSSLQDTLRLLRLMFRYGSNAEVNAALSEGFATVNIETWLEVIPQLIARIHSQNPTVRRSIHQLLVDVGKAHPQALIYPLTVASKSKSVYRRKAALAVMEKMKLHSSTLVEQALLVSQELVRVAILWNEQWHEGIEEGARLFFVEKDPAAMHAYFEPLHEMLEKGPETLREVSFYQAHARDLNEARNWSRKYMRTRISGDINQAWDLYYKVMRTLRRQLPSLTSLDLQYVSPKLLEAHDLEIAVPGTYHPGRPVITIKSFVPTIQVIASKRRPRKVTIKGSDGRDHVYVLKGHEDIRQDERVMQLFGLVNKLLAADTECFKRHLNIERYPVIPLSPNSALLGWVPGADTLNLLIREYRDSRKILVNIEQRLMLQMAPDYDNLTLMQKVEVFEYALDNTTGHDLWKVLWLRSKSSEAWLDRRTNYTRSLAVMSMVGYILGLGDRHPSNLMLDRNTGKIIHIDFGDCFEVAMHRDKYPETVPFRLTRMLMNAMEVSNIEGSFRITCEHTMRVLRDNKESLMAVLEAFVYDPLINWKLQLQPSPTAPTDAIVENTKEANMSSSVVEGIEDRPQRRAIASESELIQRENAQPDAINELAIQVLNRVQSKLTGRDFKPTTELNVPTQVDKLIEQAHSLEHLCILYVGWCPVCPGPSK